MPSKVGQVSIHASSREDATFSFHNSPHLKLFQSTRPRGRTRRLFRYHSVFAFSVSIHASSREDATITLRSCRIRSSFNPRVLAGGRDEPPVFIYDFLRFQSTRPRGRTRLNMAVKQVRLFCFNPRVLAGGRDTSIFPSSGGGLFQSTRPRGRTRLMGSESIEVKHWFQSTRPRGRTRPKIIA